jgi:alpha-mannosidase
MRTWVCAPLLLLTSNIPPGKHHIRYAILPHEGPLDARVVRAGYNFNHPMRLCHATGDVAATSRILRAVRTSGSDAVVLDCVKRGEDDEDVSLGELPKRKGRSVIVRAYEALGGQARGELGWDEGLFKVKKVWKTNLLEDDLEELEIKNDRVQIQLRPFEVATFRLQL